MCLVQLALPKLLQTDLVSKVEQVHRENHSPSDNGQLHPITTPLKAE